MRRDIDLSDKLKLVRRFTGDRFSAARGYDLRKPMSRARQKTIDKYFELAVELTSLPHKVITPKKGTKREAFAYTGQIHHPRFTKAIIHTPDVEARYTFEIDRTRPKGSRFTVVNRRTRERVWHIPAEVFLSEDPELYDDARDLDPEFFSDVIEEYGERAEVYVIRAGSYHMWGAAGTPQSVGQKLSDLFKSYGAGNFDSFDRNSSWIGNWFRGVEVYEDATEFAPYFTERVRAKAKRDAERGVQNPWQKIRQLKSGDIGIFERGRLVQVIRTETIPPLRGGRPRRR